MHNNEIRVELQKKLVVESPFLIGSPLGGLQPDICPLDEIKEDTPPLFRWDVKSNGALAPCILRPFQSDVFPHPLRAARILNLDDIGPVLGHQRGGIGLGRHRARAKHLHTVKETKIGYFLRLSHIRPFDQSCRANSTRCSIIGMDDRRVTAQMRYRLRYLRYSPRFS